MSGVKKEKRQFMGSSPNNEVKRISHGIWELLHDHLGLVLDVNLLSPEEGNGAVKFEGRFCCFVFVIFFVFF